MLDNEETYSAKELKIISILKSIEKDVEEVSSIGGYLLGLLIHEISEKGNETEAYRHTHI